MRGLAAGSAVLALALAAGLAAAQTAPALAPVPAPPAPATRTIIEPATGKPVVVSEIVARYLASPGYLTKSELPDSLKLDPAPPAPGSAALARDVEASRQALALHDTPRWRLAARDADLFSPGTTGAFSCAAGIAIGPATTPRTDSLLRRALRDLSGATAATKDFYQRKRPFVVNGQPICTPEAAETLRHNGSYPSGHSAIGYGWGLILAELVPARSTELVARGRAFGDSRRVCNVHWLSDVEEGWVVASAVVARLHAESTFRADLEGAKAELATPGLASPVPADCAREAAALATN